jgi:hypothetical protein
MHELLLAVLLFVFMCTHFFAINILKKWSVISIKRSFCENKKIYETNFSPLSRFFSRELEKFSLNFSAHERENKSVIRDENFMK